jgi:predicted DNA-binding WGR domain protein
MKIIKQIKLFYQEGTSDKVYEVDLCETEGDRYVVNFRYGRRGSNLREDSKTKQPVSLTEATKIFDKLVSSKQKGGYQELNPVDQTPQASFPQATSREETILNYLAGQDSKKWKLDRIIWRAGVLKIKEATPLLINLIGTGEPLRDYCIAWSLGMCGNEETIPHLINLQNNNQTPDFIKRIAWEAQIKLSDPLTQEELKTAQINLLPENLKNFAQNGSVEQLSEALKEYTKTGDYSQLSVLDLFYQIDNQYTRPVLLEYLTTIPLKPNYFKVVRHIFKRAEYRLDAEVLGILTYRFDQSKAYYRDNQWGVNLPGSGYIPKQQYQYNQTTRRYETIGYPLRDEKKSPNSRLAYGTTTRDYLIKRNWRTLRELGNNNDPNYVKIATEILLKYSDHDAVSVRESTHNNYTWDQATNRWQTIVRRKVWDIYANYITLNHILYQNSSRYQLKLNSKAWHCINDYKPGDPEPETREEAFPELWEQQPEALLRLLIESQCQIVHNFAVKAISNCPDFCSQIDLDTLLQLINKPYQNTTKLGFELAKKYYNSINPNLDLIIALANCTYQPARQQAHQWLELHQHSIIQSTERIFTLATSPYSDTRTILKNILTNAVFSENQIKIIIGGLISQLLSFDQTKTEIAQDFNSIILIFTQQIRTLGFNVILELLDHPLPSNQILGAAHLIKS